MSLQNNLNQSWTDHVAQMSTGSVCEVATLTDSAMRPRVDHLDSERGAPANSPSPRRRTYRHLHQRTPQRYGGVTASRWLRKNALAPPGHRGPAVGAWGNGRVATAPASHEGRHARESWPSRGVTHPRTRMVSRTPTAHGRRWRTRCTHVTCRVIRRMVRLSSQRSFTMSAGRPFTVTPE